METLDEKECVSLPQAWSGRPLVYVPSPYSISAANCFSSSMIADMSRKRQHEPDPDTIPANSPVLRDSLLNICISKLDSNRSVNNASSSRGNARRRMSMRQSVLIYNMLRCLETDETGGATQGMTSTCPTTSQITARDVLDDGDDLETDAVPPSDFFDISTSTLSTDNVSANSSDVPLLPVIVSPTFTTPDPESLSTPDISTPPSACPPVSPVISSFLPPISPPVISSSFLSVPSSPPLFSNSFVMSDFDSLFYNYDFDYEMSLFDFDVDAATGSASRSLLCRKTSVSTTASQERSVPLLMKSCSQRSELLSDELDCLMQILVGS